MPLPFRIAIQTDDIRFYHKILKIIEGSRLKANFFTSDQDIPLNKYDLVISSSAESKNSNNSDNPQFLYLQYEQIDVGFVPKIIGMIARKNTLKFQSLIIGIDPGKRIGLVAICDGMLLSAETSQLDKLIAKIQNYILIFPSEMIIIRIGDQPNSVSQVIFNKLFKVFRDVKKIKLEIVTEAYSNPKGPSSDSNLNPDEKAAFTIAQREGKITNHVVRNEIPIGRVKEIQRWSRNLSGNRISLDFKLAKSVALGDITLEKAIKQKEEQLEVKKSE
jgi:hypothetical protein